MTSTVKTADSERQSPDLLAVNPVSLYPLFHLIFLKVYSVIYGEASRPGQEKPSQGKGKRRPSPLLKRAVAMTALT